MNNTQQTLRVGLFFFLGLALAWITFESLNGGQFLKPKGYTLVAAFPHLKGLKIGDEVQMGGVKIGTVTDTRVGTGRAEAVLRITPGTRIPSDSVAVIESSSLLGSQHLAVSFGQSAEFLGNGTEISTRATPDLNEVIARFSSLGSKLEGVADNLSSALGGSGGSGSALGKIGDLVDANGPKLTEVIANLQVITAKLRDGEGTLGKLVNDSSLHNELLSTVAEIKAAAGDAKLFLNDTRGLASDVKSGQGALGTLLYDAETAANLKSTLSNLRDVSSKLASGEGTLGKLINDESMYREVQSVVKKADRALDSLGDQGPITAVGVAAQALF